MDVEGVVTGAPEKITGCTQQDVEIHVSKVRHGWNLKVSSYFLNYNYPHVQVTRVK